VRVSVIRPSLEKIMKTNGRLFLTERRYAKYVKDPSLFKFDGEPPFNPEDWIDYDFNFNLAKERKNLGLTQREMVRQLNNAGFDFVWRYISAIENGSTTPSFDFLFALKRTFNISIDDTFLADVKNTETLLDKEGLNAHFGPRLRELRTQKNLSIRDLAELFNVSHNVIYQSESQQIGPTVDILIKSSQFFGVSINDLLGVEYHDGGKNG